ncbi:MAG: FAD-binding oxidoreductase [Pseudomonadota bacterium]
MIYQSWGRYPHLKQTGFALKSRHQTPDFDDYESLLAYGNGRSYGDSCLNSKGKVAHTRYLNKFIEFDQDNGLLTCESGITFKEVIDLVLPAGWFLPVTPGTKYVTVGGAIGNDVHGKNHHVDGNFGHFVEELALRRSNGESMICSPSQNPEMFYATIGGLGLTGIIQWAKFRLKKVNSAFMEVETICFKGLDEFKLLTDQSKDSYVYTVAWVDCMAKGEELGRGIFLRANHSAEPKPLPSPKKQVTVPVNFPSFALNTYSIKAFNMLYYANGKRSHNKTSSSYYDPYFYPLDGILEWNKIYGQQGFLQYQFVVPSTDYSVIKSIFEKISASGAGSFLAVLKEFGTIESLGLLSFPREGVCLALDFPFNGEQTLKLLHSLDEMVVEAGGAVYPAKDACMLPKSFQTFYPNLEEFKKYKDEGFSSDFWRRVTGE